MEELKHKIALSWHNVEISVKPQAKGCLGKAPPTDQKTRKILNDVSGYALPGDFISIIGASGAGKTTLLNHLSGRLVPKNLDIEGTIKINGHQKDQVPNSNDVTAFVQ